MQGVVFLIGAVVLGLLLRTVPADAEPGVVMGFVMLNLGSSAAQSVILMIVVIALTFVQFRFIERRVHY